MSKTVKVREFRKEAGLTQEILSRMSGVPQSVIADIESGKVKSPTVDNLYKIAFAMGITLDDIYEPETTTAS